MKVKILLTFLLSNICVISFAQTADEYLQRGLDKYYRYDEKGIEQDITGAIQDFTKALELASDSSSIIDMERNG